MKWCLMILACDVDLEDDEDWHVAFIPKIYSFILTVFHRSFIGVSR